MTNEELFEKFKEEWDTASKLSPNLRWAIFPVGDPQLELSAATEVLKLFKSVSGILYTESGNTNEAIVAWAKAIQEKYEGKEETRLSKAAEEHGYMLHLGV